MSKLLPPATSEEIERFKKETAKYAEYSPMFHSLFPWSCELDEFVRMIRVEHLPNPYLALIGKDED